MTILIERATNQKDMKISNTTTGKYAVICEDRMKASNSRNYETLRNQITNILQLTLYKYTVVEATQNWDYTGNNQYRLEIAPMSDKLLDFCLVDTSEETDKYLDNYQIDIWVIQGNLLEVFNPTTKVEDPTLVLKDFTLMYVDPEEPGLQLFFQCQAENLEHAEEQFEETNPDCEILWGMETDSVDIVVEAYYLSVEDDTNGY